MRRLHSINRTIGLVMLLGVVLVGPASGQVEMPELGRVPINELQVIGMYNGFKKIAQPACLRGMRAFYPDADGVDYGHLPLRD